jgi:hypothetical protein
MLMSFLLVVGGPVAIADPSELLGGLLANVVCGRDYLLKSAVRWMHLPGGRWAGRLS